MIENYSELVESIVNELGRSDVSEQVPEWIRMAEVSIAREIQLSDGDQAVSGTTPAANPQIVMPVGAKRPIHIQFGTAPNAKTLSIVSFQQLTAVANNAAGEDPMAVAFVGRNGYLAPLAAVGTAYTLIYYGLPAPLSETNPTNDLLVMAPDLMKYQSLLFSAPFLGDDERLPVWGAFVTAGITTLRREYWNARASGAVLRSRVDVGAGGDGHWGGRW